MFKLRSGGKSRTVNVKLRLASFVIPPKQCQLSISITTQGLLCVPVVVIVTLILVWV